MPASLAMEHQGSARNQFLGAFSILLICLSNGAMGGWASPSIPLLMSDESPLDQGSLTIEQASWVVALVSPGGILGIIVCGWMMDRFGRKPSGLFLALPQTASWLLIYGGTDVVHLYVSRFLGGFVGGAMFTLVPIYVTEISETRIRGLLGSLLVLTVNIGVLLGFVAGAYLDYHAVPLVFMPLVAMSFVGFSLFPETPAFLARTNHYHEAERSLRHFRGLPNSGCSDSIALELENLRAFCVEGATKTTEKLSWADFAPRPVKKALVISIGLVTVNQLCGTVAMVQYSSTIFEKAGSSMSPNTAAIFVGFMQVLGAYCSTLLVERAGRKILMTLSSFGISLGLLVLAIYCYLDAQETDLTALQFVPIVSFSVVVFAANVGVLCLPFVIMSEILPPKVRTAATSFCLLFLNVLAFFAIKFLPLMILHLGLHGTVLAYSICTFLGGAFVLVTLTETRGKTLAEIMEILAK